MEGILRPKVTLPASGESGLALGTDSTPPTPNHTGKLCPAAEIQCSSPESYFPVGTAMKDDVVGNAILTLRTIIAMER